MKKQNLPGLFGDGDLLKKTFYSGGAAIRETLCKTLLNRSGISDYSFNCYTGCTNACAYCYARYMQRFHEHEETWGRFVDVKVNAVQVLSRQLARLQPGSVFSCSACDGWQAIERDYRLTRQCCRLLLEAGFSLNILTKSELVLRDLDIFKGRAVSLGVTITTADETMAGLWEPKASSVSARLKILKEAKASGLRTSVMFGPLLPGISDTLPALRALFALAAAAEVDWIGTDLLNPRPLVWPSVENLLRAHFPGMVENYRSMLFDSASREEYSRGLEQRIREAAADTGAAGLL